MPRVQSDAELYFRNMISHHHKTSDLDKARDRGYVRCPNCHRQVKFCPMCKRSMLLEKAKTLPDYVLNLSPIYIEVKRSKKDDTWSLYDFSDIQETVLNKHMTRGLDAWVFLLMGKGRMPKGKQAFLIPWEYLKAVRDDLETKSVRMIKTDRSIVPTAMEMFAMWECEWETGKGFTIPDKHTWRLKYG